MASGSYSRKNALPRSCLGTTIQMLLGTPLNKGPHIKQRIRSSPHHQLPSSTPEKTFRQWQSSACIHSSKLKLVAPNLQATKKAPQKYEDCFDTYRQHHRLQPYRITALFSSHQHKRQNQAAKASLPWVEFKLSFGRVLVTSVLWWTLSGVELSKTPSTSERKFIIECLTLSILNPSSLMLTELQKSPTSFDSFKKDVSFWSRSR